MTDNNEREFRRQVRIRTFRSFGVFIVMIIAGFGIYKWIVNGPKDDRAYSPFRKVMNINSRIFAVGYDDPAVAKEFPKEIATRRVRYNGDLGLKSTDTSGWILKVVKFSNRAPQPSDTIRISLEELKNLPKTDVVFEFKCIEGWSQITWVSGVKFSDFAAKYGVGTRDNSRPDTKNHPENIVNYCGLKTPDGGYYVGIDMPSMMHPQTILCYELNGKPLPLKEGAPLRLIIPVKYGIKHLKRIGTIFFSDEQPPDYWAARGYDYYAGL